MCHYTTHPIPTPAHTHIQCHAVSTHIHSNHTLLIVSSVNGNHTHSTLTPPHAPPCVQYKKGLLPEECMLVNTGLPDPLGSFAVPTCQVNDNNLLLLHTRGLHRVTNPKPRSLVRDLHYIWPVECLFDSVVVPQIYPLSIHSQNQRGVVRVLNSITV